MHGKSILAMPLPRRSEAAHMAFLHGEHALPMQDPAIQFSAHACISGKVKKHMQRINGHKQAPCFACD